MKVLGLTLLLATSPLLLRAQEVADPVRAEHIQKLKDYQSKHPDWQNSPSDDYVKFFKSWNEESLKITLDYHQKRCESDSSQCLSAKQERDLRSQYRVAFAVIEKQNEQAKKKIASDEKTPPPTDVGGGRAPADEKGPSDTTGSGIEMVGPPRPPVMPKVENKPKSDNGPAKIGTADKPESKPEVKPESKPEVKPESKPEVKPESKPEVKPESKPEVKPESKPEVKPETKLEEDTPKKDEEEKLEDKKEDEEVKKEEEKKEEITPEKIEEELEEFNDEEFPKNYDPNTCEWVEDLPRKIVYAPTYCSKQAAQVCTGYVVCDRKKGGGKFVRMSSCSPKNCGRSKEDAIACTKEQGFYSRRPEDERNHFTSPELKKILSTPKVRAQ